jgi:hypothetical protein
LARLQGFPSILTSPANAGQPILPRSAWQGLNGQDTGGEFEGLQVASLEIVIVSALVAYVVFACASSSLSPPQSPDHNDGYDGTTFCQASPVVRKR